MTVCSQVTIAILTTVTNNCHVDRKIRRNYYGNKRISHSILRRN